MIRRLFAVPELLILAVLALLAGFFELQNPLFLSWGNLAVLLRASAFTGICAVGMAVLLISGQIDISIGSIAGLASVVTATLWAYKMPFIPAACLGLILGGICGFINSQLVLKLHISAFLSTIATMYVFRGLAMTVTQGYTVYPLPESIGIFGAAQPLGVSWAFWIFIALLVAIEVALNFTVWGLETRATGSDREIASWTEVNVNKVNIETFIMCGALAALAAILLTARVQAGQPTMGQGWELNAIAAAAIGGVSLSGYTGSMVGVLLGVLLIQVLSNGLVAMGASAYLQPIEVGVILACTAAIDVRRRERLKI